MLWSRLERCFPCGNSSSGLASHDFYELTLECAKARTPARANLYLLVLSRNEGMTPINHPLWFPLRGPLGSFPYSPLSTSNVIAPSLNAPFVREQSGAAAQGEETGTQYRALWIWRGLQHPACVPFIRRFPAWVQLVLGFQPNFPQEVAFSTSLWMRLSRQQFLASMKSLLLCVEMPGPPVERITGKELIRPACVLKENDQRPHPLNRPYPKVLR